MTGYSPLLAIITAAVEFFAAGIAFLSKGRKGILYPTGAIFLLLAGYQIAEVAVCTRPDVLIFSQLAFFDITWLPPLGLWLTARLISPRLKWLQAVSFIYFSAAFALTCWIFIDPSCITKSVCQVVLASYSHSSLFHIIYGLFYQSGLALIVFSAAAGSAVTGDITLRKHLANMQAGVLGFLLPSLYFRIILSEQDGLLPSVMCHFALILAVSLIFLVFREKKIQQGRDC